MENDGEGVSFLSDGKEYVEHFCVLAPDFLACTASSKFCLLTLPSVSSMQQELLLIHLSTFARYRVLLQNYYCV